MLATSCEHTTPEKDYVPDDQIESEIVVGSLRLTKNQEPLRSNGSELTYHLTFVNEKGVPGLSVGITDPHSQEVGCDGDDNGSIDFYVDFSEPRTILYRDRQHNLLNKSKLLKYDSDPGRYLIIPEEVYVSPSSTRALFGGKEKFDDCFKRRMGSSLGIVMSIGSAFFGPEGPAAVAIGGALSCALWTPN